MYDLAALITQLQNDFRLTEFTIRWARDKEPSFVASQLKRILVGYHPVSSLGNLGEGQSPDAFISYTEDLSQVFQTQIICPVANFAASWNLLQSCMAGWVPYIPERDFTSITHSGGGVMGMDQGQIWWADNWRVDFSKT